MTLAKPAATGGRASHDHAASHLFCGRVLTVCCAADERVAARASRRIASLKAAGGDALASGA
jgi:hypothetical protein